MKRYSVTRRGRRTRGDGATVAESCHSGRRPVQGLLDFLAVNTDQINAVLTDPFTTDLIDKCLLMYLAYTGIDGAPRVAPVGYVVRDGRFITCSASEAEKVGALRADPRVALTVDTLEPLGCLLVRGTAEVEIVEGIPEEYLAASRRGIPPERLDDFEAQVRGLYDEMARIVVTPTWVRLNDFVRTAPRAVEQLVAAKS